MAPIVHLIRHAQGYHNLPPESENKHIRDADLSPAGRDACRAFAAPDAFPPELLKVELVCASPLKRAIGTALLALAPALDVQCARAWDGGPAPGGRQTVAGRGVVLALPDAQEANADPCNTGSDVGELRQMFATGDVDLSEVDKRPDWCSNEGEYGALRGEVERRAKRFRRWLRSRPEAQIAVVGHGMFWHFVTGEVGGPDAKADDGPDVWFEQQTGPYWLNLMWRTYEFNDDDDEEEARLVETRASQLRTDAAIKNK